MRAASENRSTRARTRRGAFTLIELLVAIIVLTIGVLALASSAPVILAMANESTTSTTVAALASSRFERLAASCASIASGSATAGAITEQWSVSAAGASLFDVVDSMTFATRRGVRSEGFRSYVAC